MILKPYFVLLLDLIPALGGKQKTEEFFMKLAHMLVEYMNKQQDRATKVSAYSHTKASAYSHTKVSSYSHEVLPICPII